MPGVSAFDDSASTSDHASSASAAACWRAAARPATVGETRRLAECRRCVPWVVPWLAHSVWSIKGGEYDCVGAPVPGSPTAGGAAEITAKTAGRTSPRNIASSTAGAVTEAFIQLAGLALNFEQFGPDVDQIEACCAGCYRHPQHVENKGQ